MYSVVNRIQNACEHLSFDLVWVLGKKGHKKSPFQEANGCNQAYNPD
jgi:hypothetical protein